MYSEQWGDENMREFLMALRNVNDGDCAVDERAKKIMGLVNENIKVEVYTLAEFIPKHWISHPYDEDELIVSPVKKLLRVSARLKNFKLEKLCWGLPLTRAIGLTSRVQTKEGLRHIPMIDFRGMGRPYQGDFSSPDKEVDEALNKVGMEGIVISSGNSYHFYGFKLLTPSQWFCFMEALDQAIPYVDQNWPKLQLKQGYSMLRLTPAIRKFSQPCYLRRFHPKKTGTDWSETSASEGITATA